MSKYRPVVALIGIAMIMVLTALDQTVVGTALPQVVADLQGFALYPWVAAAYLLTSAILVPVTGRLGDLHGRKPYMLSAIALFTLASAFCGMAQSMPQLVLARGLQGIGGGMLAGTAFASVSDLFPDIIERVRWQVILSAAYGISSGLGPALGGWMTEHLGWRSVFYVNLPVGLLAILIVWRYLPQIIHSKDGSKPVSMDWAGALLLALAITGLLMLAELGDKIGFATPLFWGLLLCSLLFCVLFVRHQRRAVSPIIPLELFADKTVQRLAVIAVGTGFILFSLLFYAPLLLQGGFSFSPKEAGLVITPLLASLTVGSIINSRLIPRMHRAERLFSWGTLLLMAGLLLLCAISADTPHALMAAAFALCGFSFGFQTPNLTLQIQTAVAQHHVGIASALIMSLRTLGSMFGASIAGLAVNLGFNHSAKLALLKEGLTDNRVVQLFSTPQLLVRQADQARLIELGQHLGFDPVPLLEQARTGLVSGVHYAFALCLLLAIPCYWLSRKLPPLVRRSERIEA